MELLTLVTNRKQAKQIHQGLTATSKMPCKSYNTPAIMCNTGSKLVNIKNSTCSGCYALKGNYLKYAKTIIPAGMRRYEAIKNNPKWVEAMAFDINYEYEKFGIAVFRWHDSGDLIDVEHLQKIAEICTLTPNVKHWLPTREYKIVNDYMKVNTNNKYRPKPKNLIIRLSALMLDAAPTENRYNLPTSTVSTKPSNEINYKTFKCPAPKQDNQCLDCRACWSSEVKNVAYAKH